MTTTSITVTGMTCQHCVNAVTEEVGALDGVTGVTVDLATGRVDVESAAPVPADALAAAVDEAGYEIAPS
ncbi:copper ion binding protein [Rhodococcus kroppenstedtii]|uniref:Copper ion binding protein n=1 Tax=Rhodococcoides kroppenstedtii TaxID=293050 RepID=A0A1I0THG0_9NOCA|nr:MULTISPECIES: copper ion binding protein [Rhodococcus]AMY21235.1 Copper chaperone CopZ [Rhodococcus sp. PBTS 1]MBY6314643.1 heavy-metal-associated domain-containing protein [Rhodococcus kroppenstedtii]MBY6322450.1 heavy-metal-associated domain-containing protein [Rhodococcus kroppenstedtii]MBY6401254.1 heavy-metal-associated domain-containing protein [Rhodococcus kroppenstedtii]MBY6437626.1 heavy-metal-associated domain-containing protein [Rhodococcus kroppenstedtii]